MCFKINCTSARRYRLETTLNLKFTNRTTLADNAHKTPMHNKYKYEHLQRAIR